MSGIVKIFAVAAALALPVAACAPTRTSESTGQYVDDAAITTKVKTAIIEDPVLKVMEIEVKTSHNTVQLKGYVTTPQMVAHASDLARQVGGVTGVENDLIVR